MGVRLTVSAVAHRLGIAPSTLRTWDRRYGVGPSEHQVGSHRRYTGADLLRLDAMRKLVLDGVAPADAARTALGESYDGAVHAPERVFADQAGGLRPRHVPGGRVLPLPGADDLVRGLGRAAMALDGDAVLVVLAGQLTDHGVIRTWDDVIAPLLVSAGARWESTGTGIEVEHLLVDCVVTALRQHGSAQAARAAARPVLLVCAPAELHAVPLYALAAGLAERGHGSLVLGASVPPAALHAALRRTGAAVLFLWSQTPGTGDPTLLAGLPMTRPPTSVVVGGPGWPLAALPDRVSFAPHLSGALDLIDQALHG